MSSWRGLWYLFWGKKLSAAALDMPVLTHACYIEFIGWSSVKCQLLLCDSYKYSLPELLLSKKYKCFSSKLSVERCVSSQSEIWVQRWSLTGHAFDNKPGSLARPSRATGFPPKLRLRLWGVTIDANLKCSTSFLKTWRNHSALKMYNRRHGAVVCSRWGWDQAGGWVMASSGLTGVAGGRRLGGSHAHKSFWCEWALSGQARRRVRCAGEKLQ